MKYLIPFFALLLIGCKTNNKIEMTKSIPEYKIVQINLGDAVDRIDVCELRIYKPKSALDATVMMYKEFGEWNEKLPGKNQENINQYFWEELSINDSIKMIKVITDGKETMEDYYTSFIIFDNEVQDCLSAEHIHHQAIVDFVLGKMKNFRGSNKDYQMLQKK